MGQNKILWQRPKNKGEQGSSPINEGDSGEEQKVWSNERWRPNEIPYTTK